MIRLLVVSACVWASAAAAAGLPKIAVHPLQVTDGTPRERESLQVYFELQLAALKAFESPPSSRVSQALLQQAGKGCDQKDVCLRFLAEATSSVYATFATIGLDAKGEAYVVAARVVRVDGERVRTVQNLTFTKGPKVSFVDGAKVALRELIERLKLGELEPTLPVKSPDSPVATKPEPVAPPPSAVTPSVVQPTPAPVERSTPAMKLAAYGVAGAGGVALVSGGVLGVLALTGRGNITPDENGNVPRSQLGEYQAVNRNATIAAVLLGAGAALVGVGAGLSFLSPDAPAQVSIVPTAGGAQVGLSVVLP